MSDVQEEGPTGGEWPRSRNIDLEGDIVEEPGEGLTALAKKSGEGQTNESGDEVHEEEEWTPEPFRVPEGMTVMQKPALIADLRHCSTRRGPWLIPR